MIDRHIKEIKLKHFLITLLFFPLLVQAQVIKAEKTIECAPLSFVLEALAKSDYEEMPVWIGQQENTHYSLFVGGKTKTWTLIQFDEKVACVLGSGLNSKMIYDNLISNEK